MFLKFCILIMAQNSMTYDTVQQNKIFKDWSVWDAIKSVYSFTTQFINI